MHGVSPRASSSPSRTSQHHWPRVMPRVSVGTPLLVPRPGGSPVAPEPEPSARLLEVSCWALGCLGLSLHTLSLPDSIQPRALNITNTLKRPLVTQESPAHSDRTPTSPNAPGARTSVPATAFVSEGSIYASPPIVPSLSFR